MDKPKRLGRGLSSLLSTNTPVQVDVSIQAVAGDNQTSQSLGRLEQTDGLVQILVADVVPNRYQPRRVIDDLTISQLAASIRTSGLMQPVVVRPLIAGGGGGHGGAAGAKWELVAGERRWRAATEAGLRAIPAVVRPLSDKECAEWAIVENVQREDLNPIDKAQAFRALSEQFGMTQAEIAERLGLERSTVANLVRLTELEPPLQELVSKGELSAGHAKALLSMEAEPAMSMEQRGRVVLGKRAALSGWSIRALEGEMKKWEGLKRARKGGSDGIDLSERDPEKISEAKTKAILADLGKRLGEQLGTKVRIQPRAGERGATAGRIIIEYYDLDHFDSVMDKIGP